MALGGSRAWGPSRWQHLRGATPLRGCVGAAGAGGAAEEEQGLVGCRAALGTINPAPLGVMEPQDPQSSSPHPWGRAPSSPSSSLQPSWPQLSLWVDKTHRRHFWCPRGCRGEGRAGGGRVQAASGLPDRHRDGVAHREDRVVRGHVSVA